MKKKFIMAALLSAGIMFANTAVKAQGAYAKLGLAYNFGIGSNTEGSDFNTTQNGSGSSATFTSERVKVNYGKGITAGGAIGYMFNEHVGAELGIDYLIGSKTEVKDDAGTTRGSQELYSRMLLLKPSLVISAGMQGINPYARFGMVLGKGKAHNIGNSTTGSEKTEFESEFSGGWGVGLQSGLGVEFGVSDNMTLYTELTMSNLTYSPDKWELTKYTVNEIDVLGNINTRDKETEFSDEVTESSSSGKPSEPSQNLKMSLPFSSVGIGLGLKFKF